MMDAAFGALFLAVVSNILLVKGLALKFSSPSRASSSSRP